MSSRPRSGSTPTDASSWRPSNSPFWQRAYRRRDIVTVPAHEILRLDLMGHIYHLGNQSVIPGKTMHRPTPMACRHRNGTADRKSVAIVICGGATQIEERIAEGRAEKLAGRCAAAVRGEMARPIPCRSPTSPTAALRSAITLSLASSAMSAGIAMVMSLRRDLDRGCEAKSRAIPERLMPRRSISIAFSNWAKGNRVRA